MHAVHVIQVPSFFFFFHNIECPELCQLYSPLSLFIFTLLQQFNFELISQPYQFVVPINVPKSKGRMHMVLSPSYCYGPPLPNSHRVCSDKRLTYSLPLNTVPLTLEQTFKHTNANVGVTVLGSCDQFIKLFIRDMTVTSFRTSIS